MFETNNSWELIVKKALSQLDDDYLSFLKEDKGYFPSQDNFLNAFKTLPLERTKYILFGQDPYPREQSAIGYAFIDGDVKSLWDENNGLSKEVNKATSLRNFMKMLLVSNGSLAQENTTKEAIVKLDKSAYINSILKLRDNFEKNGILLLNTALIFTNKEDSKRHVKQWQPFIKKLLEQIKDEEITLILFGTMAKEIQKIPASENFKHFICEHPYNTTFISNKNVQKFFSLMKLLEKS